MGKNGSVLIERVGNDEQSFVEVFTLLLDQHREVGLAPLDREKAAWHTYGVLSEGMTYVARRADGTPIGTLGMTEQEYWYGRASYLIDAWFYVAPRYRRGPVGSLLMEAATKDADAKGVPAYIDVFNSRRRPKKTKAALMCVRAGYLPVGYTLQLR